MRVITTTIFCRRLNAMVQLKLLLIAGSVIPLRGIRILASILALKPWRKKKIRLE